MDLLLGIKIFLFSILVALLFWWFGREHVPDFTENTIKHLRHILGGLGVLWNMGLVEVKELTATILDLARRKHIRIEKTSRKILPLLRGKSGGYFAQTRTEATRFLFNTRWPKKWPR